MSELKPCPFCGGRAKYIYRMPYNAVKCTKCGTFGKKIVDSYEQQDGKAEAIEAWNRRAENKRYVDRIKAQREEIRRMHNRRNALAQSQKHWKSEAERLKREAETLGKLLRLEAEGANTLNDFIAAQQATIERLTAERDAMHQDILAAEEYAWTLKARLKEIGDKNER